MKNKTMAAWLAFMGGPIGLHRFYLHGSADLPGWLMPIPTLMGLYGLKRIQQNGIEDSLSWLLLPLLGFTIASCALTAIVYGLMSTEKWNERFNPAAPLAAAPGETSWLTVGAIALSLLVGTTVLLSSIVFCFQRYFELQNQATEAHSITEKT